MKKRLGPGMIVMIYEDPVTCKKKEGRAKLIEEIRPDEGDGLSMWLVEFRDDPKQYQRTVKV